MYPILFSLGPISFYSYGFVVAVGFFVAILMLTRLIERASLNLQFIADHFFALLIFSLIGARLLYVVLYWDEFSFDIVRIFYLWEGGFIAIGGIIAFLMLFAYFARQNQEDFSRWLDVMVGPAMIWALFEHIASFLSGKSFGLQTHLPWGIQFDNPEMPYAGIPVHPTQIYAALIALIIFVWVRTAWSRTIRPSGIGYVAFSSYLLGVLIIEFLRGDFVPIYFGLRATQILELLLAVLFLTIYFRSRKAV